MKCFSLIIVDCNFANEKNNENFNYVEIKILIVSNILTQDIDFLILKLKYGFKSDNSIGNFI